MYLLDDDQIRALAPAVYQETPAPSVSSRYAFVSTHQIVDALRAEGWEVSSAAQARTRLVDRRPYARHLLRFRRPDAAPRDFVGEVVIGNAHQANGCYLVWGGAFRTVCLNGHVIGDNLIPSIRVRHTYSAVQGVLEATTRIAEKLPELERYVQAMRDRPVSREEQMGLALRALNVRWPDGNAPVGYEQLLHVRREEDAPLRLWEVFNRIQENVISPAGLLAFRDTRGRRRPLRGLTDIRAIEINRALWDQAQALLEAA